MSDFHQPLSEIRKMPLAELFVWARMASAMNRRKFK
jgi:hypothetical protein